MAGKADPSLADFQSEATGLRRVIAGLEKTLKKEKLSLTLVEDKILGLTSPPTGVSSVR